LFRSDKFRKAIGIPEYLPGSKLERLNVKQVIAKTIDQPTVFDQKPSAGSRKKAEN